MATETGVIMLVYLREAIENKGGLENIQSEDELRETIMNGAVHRLRPKILTEATAIIGIAPMLWASGVGAEVIRPMAAPVLGGLLIADEVIDVFLPVLFFWVRKRRWKKLKKSQPSSTMVDNVKFIVLHEVFFFSKPSALATRHIIFFDIFLLKKI